METDEKMIHRQLLTKPRAVKKLYILNPGDVRRFTKIVSELSRELCFYTNTFLVNDEDLFSENNKAFVHSHDPDFIVNYSNRSKAALISQFNRKVFESSEDVPSGTPASIVNGVNHIERYSKEENDVWIYCEDEDEKIDISKLLLCGNWRRPEKINDHIDAKILGNSRIKILEGIKETVELSLKPYDSIMYAHSRNSFRQGGGSSVYERNYNHDNHFSGNQASLIVSGGIRLDSMVFYWNERASYPGNRMLWVSTEHLLDYLDLIDDFSFCVLFGTDSMQESLLLSRLPDLHIIDPVRYYFHGNQRDWMELENTSIGIEKDGELAITHPNQKLFSSIGFNTNFILEVGGLEEFFFPQSASIGDLFYHNEPAGFENWEFSRLSRYGLAIYCREFHPFSTYDVTKTISLPQFEDMVVNRLSTYGYTAVRSSKTNLLEKTLELFGDNISYLSDKRVFDFFIKLSPKRIGRIVQDLTREFDSNIDDIEAVLHQLIDSKDMIASKKINTFVEMRNIAQFSGENREHFAEIFEGLIHSRVVLRGKKYTCANCESDIWIPINDVKDENRCNYCGNSEKLPLMRKEKAGADYFVLNELVAKAVDQGQITMLPLLNVLRAQSFWGIREVSNLLIERNDTKENYGDVDLVVSLGNKLGLVEVKSNSIWNREQSETLFALASDISADFIIMSTLLQKSNQEVRAFAEWLQSKMLNYPILLITSDSLFSRPIPNLTQYFRLSTNRLGFASGPIII